MEMLHAKGFRAVRFDEGVPEWRTMGLPVAEYVSPTSGEVAALIRRQRKPSTPIDARLGF